MRFHGQVKRRFLVPILFAAAACLVAPTLLSQAADDKSADDSKTTTEAAAVVASQHAKPVPVLEQSSGSTIEQGLDWARELFLLRIGDNEAARFIASFLVLLAAVVLRRVVIVVVFAFLRKLAKRTTSRFDDRLLAAVQAPASASVLVIGIFVALTILTLPPDIDAFLLLAFKAGLLVVVFWGFMRAVDVLADVLTEVAKEKDLGIATFAPLLKKTTRFFFFVIGVILIIQNLGYSVGSLLAGLGIGGLAVALAAQDTIANFFGSIVVAVDRPMRVGDYVNIGDHSGTVEEVGLRSTRLRTRERTLVTIPNKMMANEVIENFSAISRRRIQMTLGVTYETTADEMEAVLEDLRKVLAADDSVDPNEMQAVRFNAFGSSSLDILVIFYANVSDYVGSLEVREKVSLKLMRAVLARGLSFAFPTQTLYLEGEIARKLAESRSAPSSPPTAAD